MLIEDRELARKNGQSSAAIRATELLGKELAQLRRLSVITPSAPRRGTAKEKGSQRLCYILGPGVCRLAGGGRRIRTIGPARRSQQNCEPGVCPMACGCEFHG